jgi:hypothetical protein
VSNFLQLQKGKQILLHDGAHSHIAPLIGEKKMTEIARMMGAGAVVGPCPGDVGAALNN